MLQGEVQQEEYDEHIGPGSASHEDRKAELGTEVEIDAFREIEEQPPLPTLREPGESLQDHRTTTHPGELPKAFDTKDDMRMKDSEIKSAPGPVPERLSIAYV